MSPILEHLRSVFFQVREYLLSHQKATSTVGKNPKGDNTKEFDLEAEKIVINYLLKHFPKSRILSEEIGMVNESLKEYDYFFVIDPVDGSVNFEQGVPLVGFAIAVIKGPEISTETVEYAFLGQIYSGYYFTAEKGKGAYFRDQRLMQNPKISFEDSIVTCSLNRLSPEHFLLFQSINRSFRQIRAFGCSSIDLSYVIQGISSAHYDFKKRTTAENFLSAALILEEMGGKLTDLRGEPIKKIENLVEGYSFIASHNAKDHLTYIDVLKNPDLYSR